MKILSIFCVFHQKKWLNFTIFAAETLRGVLYIGSISYTHNSTVYHFMMSFKKYLLIVKIMFSLS